ncbi:MAG: N-acetylmuramoyl-L-alanine amidase [Desulfuromonadales bacterium]|nr:N-acetylmuramoyl-L-alanine amidase [Desulfuromonadales bacterium]MDW7758278.1 N-acetylmuramoyl-L-alanine amidase [Desulfuromonadales bacterium]
MFLVRGVLIAFFCLLAVQPVLAQDAEKDYRQAKASYQKLLDSRQKQLYRENWLRVRNQFVAVKEKYPRHPRAADSLYMAGKTSEGLYRVSLVAADAREAVAFYDDLATLYPESNLADDGLYLSGTILEKTLAEGAQAYLRFARLIERYPQGDMVAKARPRVRELARYATSSPPPSSKPATSDTGSRQLTGIRFWSNPDTTRIVLDLEGSANYVVNQLHGDPKKQTGPRIYIDILGASPSLTLSDTMDVNDGLLRQIRTGVPAQGTVRVVLDLTSLKDYKVFSLDEPYRIVIDVEADRQTEITASKPVVSALPPSAQDGIAGILERTPEERPLQVHIPQASSGNVMRRIVIDPGHGGKDPGAIGPSGVFEKDIVLKLAKALKPRLEKDLGVEVLLTRDRDIFIPLEERTAFANKVGADLFISLHANASPSRKAYGIETYYLNFSKNDKAAALAARENGTSLKEVGDLELILFDLMANAKINESSRLAAEIQNSLVNVLSKNYSKVKDLGVRQGPFYVLLGATMPSVLVETAFISNKMEESRLLSDKYRDRTVAAISQGVRNYTRSLKMMASN